MSRAEGADEVVLPVKRTEGETLAERLTDNAYENILPARYLRRNADGELVEDPEDLFPRVARNVALAEAVYEAERRDVEVTVTPDQLKPGHPRRDELAAEVFGAGTAVGDDAETVLTEHNVGKFAYDTVVPELPDAVREHVESVAAEFEELMEDLSFVPNCVPPDSLVAANGGLKPLTEVDPGERVYDDEDGYANVQEKYENGEKLVLEIETASGYSVRATPEHYFRVITEDGEYEWRQVKDIEPGHTVALQKNFLDDEGEPSQLEAGVMAADGGSLTSAPTTTNSGRPRSAFETPDAMTPDLAEWLGLYVGDGTARESGVRVAFADVDEDLAQHWVALTESVFGFEPTTRTRTDAACIVGQAFRRDLYDFIERNDLLKEASETATVPDAVLRSGRTCIASFLGGLFEADGTVNDRSIELYTHSEPLAAQVQKLLLGLGIRSKVTEKRDGYRVTIRKNVCGRRFVERVGFISERKSIEATRFVEVSDNATSVKVPNQTERLHEWFQESDLGLDAYRDLSQFLIDSGSEHHQEIGKEIFGRYAEKYPELNESPVAEHVERDQIYESVTTITEMGTMAVEDMQVPRRNTYVVEGFVSHNSPTLMNAGDELQQLSACFVDSPEDDLKDIHETAREAAEVFQCLTEDARVHVAGEGVVSVADVEPGDVVRQRGGSGRVAETHAYDDAPVRRVTTPAGLELTGTPNHELLVDGEWTRIDEVEPGDTLSVRLGWLPDEDETEPLRSVDAGSQWAANRTVTNEAVAELHAEGLSDYEIADRLDCSASTVQRRRANELDLEPNGTGGRSRGSVSFDVDAFGSLYEDGRSDGEMAAELGVSAATVGQYRATQSLPPNGTPAKSVAQPTRLTSDLAELLGMWVGDGSEHADGIRFHLRREETLEHADRLCRHLFDEGLDWRFEEGCYDAVLHSHEVKRFWLRNFGDAKPDAPSASVPEQLWRADHGTVAAFLRGLFSTDGSLQKGTRPRLWSASETLVDGVQQLLVGIGIPAAVWTLDDERRDYYNVGPTSELGLTRFADDVGFVDARHGEMRETLAETDRRGTTFGTVRDDETWALPVESVEEAGTATVYDVTVAGDHEYLADGVVSHNSGGGMGYAFWRLRPFGDAVGSTGGIASGPITFMETFDQMCFVPGTKVLTPDGNVPIEELEAGRLVVDENGDARQVTETMERFIDEAVVEVTPERINKPIRVTAEHPFKVVSEDGFEWVEAGDLREDDLLVLGHAAGSNSLELDETVDLADIASGPLVVADGGIAINRQYYGSAKGPSPRAIDTRVPVADFATVAGWYLAEGCVVYRRGIPNEVTFTLNIDERDAAEEIADAVDSFGAPTRFEPVEERNTLVVHVESASFAQFVEGQFGTGAAHKRVPEVLWRAPVSTQARVLEALFDGDGTLQERGRSQRVQLHMANEEIVDFVFQAGLRCGVQFSRHERTPEDRLETYWASLSVSSALGTPLERLFDELSADLRATDRTKQEHGREVVAVGSIETSEYRGPVHNVEVADTHTYVAEDVVVHNCETIAQGGTRRGAQMAIMRVSHPDVVEFVHAKRKAVSLAHSLKLNDPDDYTYTTFNEALAEARELIDDRGRVPEHLRNAVEGHLSNFNISVGVTDDFMEAVESDSEYTFVNPRTGEPHVATEETEEMYERYGLGEHVEPGEELSVPARVVWECIIEGAHENGEPGVVYLDRINDEHSFPVESTPTGDGSEYEILATNPCGEQPLMEYEACNLGHINLSTVADLDAPDWRVWSERHGDDHDDREDAVAAFLEAAVDWDEFDRRIEWGTRFLDDVVTMSDFPIEEIKETVRRNRKVGLGIMGLAQLYVQLGVEYGSDVANEMARQLMLHVNHGSKWTSHELAEERGSFANWEDSKYADPTEYREWFEHHTGVDAGEWADGFPIRNHNTTTIAPTGTTSMVGNTSGGCEPIPNVAYYKNVSDDVQGEEMLVEFDDYFLRVLEANDIEVEAVKKEAKRQMADNEYAGIEGLATVPDEIGELFVVTADLTGKDHAEVQIACQAGVDSAISKTINAPNEADLEDTDEAFRYIWREGGKGVTYYRDGTRSKQVITTRAKNVDYADMDEAETVETLLERVEEALGGLDEFLEHEAVREELEDTLGDVLVGGAYARERPRPDVLHGVTQRIQTGYGKMYVNINEDPETGEPFELFITIGNSGGFTNAFTDALAKVISYALRSGVDPYEIAEDLQGIRSPKVAWDKGEQINSIPDAVGVALRRYLDDEIDKRYPRQQTLEETAEGDESALEPGGAVEPGDGPSERRSDGGAQPARRGDDATPDGPVGPGGAGDDSTPDQQTIIDAGESPECPECGAMALQYSEGCKTCESCGWSEC